MLYQKKVCICTTKLTNQKRNQKKQKDGNYKEHKLIKQKAKLREHKAKTWFLDDKTQN